MANHVLVEPSTTQAGLVKVVLVNVEEDAPHPLGTAFVALMDLTFKAPRHATSCAPSELVDQIAILGVRVVVQIIVIQ